MTMNRRQMLAASTGLALCANIYAQEASPVSTATRPLRRTARQLTQEQTLEVIKATDHAVLSTCDKAGYPYGVPITPVLEGDHLYFHATGTKGGRKEDNMLMNPNVSVAFVSKANTLGSCYSVDFASAIVRGKAHKVTDPKEIAHAFDLILGRHAPSNSKTRNDIQKKVRGPYATVWKIDIEHIDGKARAAKEWIKGRSATELHDTCTSAWLQGVPK